MNRGRLRNTAGLLGLLAAAGCGPTPVDTVHATPQDLVVNVDQSGGSWALAPGQRLIVRLSSNPSTGYRWAFIGPVSDAVKPDGPSTFEPDPGATHRIGAGGVEVWRFIAARAGQATLRFNYGRPWEDDRAPARTARYEITVR